MELIPKTVSEVNEYIKIKFDDDFMLQSIPVKGEIANYVAHRSGHSYFSLKDENASIKAVLFKGYKQHLPFVPENGMSVIAIGDINVYTRDGVYQLYVKHMFADGVGAFYAKYDQLKEKLEKEGLFDPERKKPIPKFPQKIGIVTSATGAAMQDIKNVILRRYPVAELLLYPVNVQGESAPSQIAKGIFALNRYSDVDVMIVGRGGGSVEDLNVFNDESLARAIAASNIPVVSAVGHEIDFTIADYVADLRAPTPSAAAELVTPNIEDLLLHLEGYQHKLETLFHNKIKLLKIALQNLTTTLDAKARVALQGQTLLLQQYKTSMMLQIHQKMATYQHQLDRYRDLLQELAPRQVLQRGYVMVEKDAKAIPSASMLHGEDHILLRFYDGSLQAKIMDTGENQS